MTEDVLVKVDRMSMAVSLEVRCPLLDHRILEFAAQLPAELKLRAGEGKRLLRHLASQRLPREIVERPKQGFSPPVAEWLRGDLREIVDERLFSPRSALSDFTNLSIVRQLWKEHLSRGRDHSQLLWALVAFRQWEDHYLGASMALRPSTTI
jgi:asparagine synthase (glutamine-hydrolysing)